jgi:hypothetical protein
MHMFDPYSSCPCGSGKKFKWCCQAIHTSLAKVFALDEEGQHEAALRLMDEVVAANAANPEVWGRKALLQFQNDKPEEAEKTLDKAFELQANYAFGYLLKARFRLVEGEVAGGLMLLRKAADLYDPGAKEILAQIYIDIFDCEMKFNHPIAAHAAAEMAAKFAPANENLRNAITTVFGKDNPNLPPSAIRKYEFKAASASAAPERKAQRSAALLSAATGRLTDALKAFEQSTQGEGAEAADWYNLALCQAWTGNNLAAVAALDRYVALESDETQAAQAWTLAEVLRLGHGMEDQADVVEHSIIIALADPNAFVAALGEMEREGLLAGVRVNQEEGVLSAMILEVPGPALTPESQQNPKLAAYILVVGTNNFARLWNVTKDTLQSTFNRLAKKAARAIAQAQPTYGPAKYTDLLTEGLSFARKAVSQEDAAQRMRAGFNHFFEEVWMQRPLKSLGGVSPAVAAAGQGELRKKLRGVVQFMRECGELAKFPIDFSRLTHKLGLDVAPSPQASALPAPATVTGLEASPPRDIAAMNAAELAGLAPAGLSAAEVEQAFQAALKLDARDLAAKFAADLVARPPYAERPDRFALFQFLINQSLAQKDAVAALDRVNEGEKDDCENNGGKRRNDYELRRAQVHAKGGEFDQAEQVFDHLIARIPSELNVRVSAAEAMLSARQGARARKYAEQGLAEALKQNNRDLEGHFRELVAAAQK